jgi:hypothetical protein
MSNRTMKTKPIPALHLSQCLATKVVRESVGVVPLHYTAVSSQLHVPVSLHPGELLFVPYTLQRVWMGLTAI